ncbi:hypothetical protein PVL29_014032 [Vitis rotundifolia]|uniref:Uncharacterized protein n=1 Tax=Vitis rotundifolia TaxID=103349 RepID=A0AA38ZGV3_VITRO|nr:hypothetical protein PVL29_014032 [Vitis rotundifolia]
MSTGSSMTLLLTGCPQSPLDSVSTQSSSAYWVPAHSLSWARRRSCSAAVAYRLYEVIGVHDCMDSEAPDFFRLAKVIEGCRFVAIRSCAELEGDSLSLLEKLYQKPVVPVGLLPAEVNNSERDESWDSLRQWLDEKIQNSVLYVAIGTELTLSQDEMNELASGIEKSGLPFIWVVKTKDDPIITRFESRVSGRGLVWANWAPQKQILAHPSIGGFLTHCGWSSVIEVLTWFGQPCLCPRMRKNDSTIQ